MIEQVYESSSEGQHNDPISPAHIDLSQYIPPPNPITTKTIEQQQPQNIQNLRKRHLYKSSKLLQSSWAYNQEVSLQNFYDKEILIFQKFQNKKCRERNGVKYASSMFSENLDTFWDISKYLGMLKSEQIFSFDSNYQSANLFQVYKTGDHEYDLVLHNDLNTTGYAQWFNFKIKNQLKNTSVQLNIVNMYKSSSLYQKGMKPLALSVKEGKKWQRNTYQVQYYENQIPTQRDPNKFYYTLSFCYEFKHDADEVQFCHFFPYTSVDCQNFLQNINGSSKVRIKNLGNSSLRKPIPIIQLFSETQNTTQKAKKAIVIIGRQHSGETQSSFLVEEIVTTLLANTNESQFLLQKFDIYICPMLNIDGVYLGNYRTNAYGYDLNRYWHTDNQLKIPEVFYFKKFINNLKKRNKISLILDLHGHSKKLNSFFYGNPFGKNYMMLPFVASKMCDMIKFKSCTFKQEKSQKSKTARAVLGNLLKDTTYIYTFEVSFWGYKKNNRVLPYTIQNLKQLSKTLVSSIYKVFMQEIKEEITLKESVYFKEINKELSCLTQNYFEKQSGSDSEAENLTVKEDFQKVSGVIKNDKQNNRLSKIKDTYFKSKQVGTQVDFIIGSQMNLKSPEVFIYSKQGNNQQELSQSLSQRNDYQLFPKKNIAPGSKNFRSPKTKQLFMSRQTKKKQQQAFYHLAYDNHFQTKQNFYFQSPQNNQLNNTSRKQFLLQKLRIFGETFVQNFQPQNKQKLKGAKSIAVQVPDLIESQKKIMLDSIISRNKSQSLRHQDSSFQKYIEKLPHQNVKQIDKWLKTREVKKSFPKRKSDSMVLNKSALQQIISLNQKSLQKLSVYNQGQQQSNPFMLKISKSPLVKIQKIPNLNTMMGNELKQRPNIYDNINKLKNSIAISCLKSKGTTIAQEFMNENMINGQELFSVSDILFKKEC